MNRVVKILDCNSLMENPVLGKISASEDLCGIGLWFLASFVNHSCAPNARRMHIGDWILVRASKDISQGQEINFAYFDVFQPLKDRRAQCRNWGFFCECERCEIEEKHNMVDLESEDIVELEEALKTKEVLGKKEKGMIRVSYWDSYWKFIRSSSCSRSRGRENWGESLAAAELTVGCDERMLSSEVVDWINGGGGGGEMVYYEEERRVERAVRICRAMYGKSLTKKAITVLLERKGGARSCSSMAMKCINGGNRK